MEDMDGHNPMVFSKSKSQVQMKSVIGVTFDAQLELVMVVDFSNS